VWCVGYLSRYPAAPWCYCRRPETITRLLFWAMALRHKGCQCRRRAVVLHSPRGLRESLPEQSDGPTGPAALSVVEKAAPRQMCLTPCSRQADTWCAHSTCARPGSTVVVLPGETRRPFFFRPLQGGVPTRNAPTHLLDGHSRRFRERELA